MNRSFLSKIVDKVDWQQHISFDALEECYLFHRLEEGYSWLQCTGYAITLGNILRSITPLNLQVVGRTFDTHNTELSCGGHDVLLVDNRYILDAWPGEVLNRHDLLKVYDIYSESDMVIFSKYFGPFGKFEHLIDIRRNL